MCNCGAAPASPTSRMAVFIREAHEAAADAEEEEEAEEARGGSRELTSRAKATEEGAEWAEVEIELPAAPESDSERAQCRSCSAASSAYSRRISAHPASWAVRARDMLCVLPPPMPLDPPPRAVQKAGSSCEIRSKQSTLVHPSTYQACGQPTM